MGKERKRFANMIPSWWFWATVACLLLVQYYTCYCTVAAHEPDTKPLVFLHWTLLIDTDQCRLRTTQLSQYSSCQTQILHLVSNTNRSHDDDLCYSLCYAWYSRWMYFIILPTPPGWKQTSASRNSGVFRQVDEAEESALVLYAFQSMQPPTWNQKLAAGMTPLCGQPK